MLETNSHKKEFIINRFVSSIGRNVKLTFPGQEANQIRFWFSDEPPLFGIFGGTTRNFEVILERDKIDTVMYSQVTIILLNDNHRVVERWHKGRLVSLLGSNKHFNLMSLYSVRIFDLPDALE